MVKCDVIIETAYLANFKRLTIQDQKAICAICVSNPEGWQACFLCGAQTGDLHFERLQLVDDSCWQRQHREISLHFFKARPDGLSLLELVAQLAEFVGSLSGLQCGIQPLQ